VSSPAVHKHMKKAPQFLATNIPRPIKITLNKFGATPSPSEANTYISKIDNSLVIFTYVEEHPLIIVTIAQTVNSDREYRDKIDKLNSMCMVGTHIVDGSTYVFRGNVWPNPDSEEAIPNFESLMDRFLSESRKGYKEITS